MSYNSTHTGPEIDDAISKVENGLPIQNGGTGANNAAGARTNLDIYSKSEVDSALSAKAAQTSLDSHTGNKSNPHSVTKSQVGLDNVPNVATNDQTPTYTEATTLADYCYTFMFEFTSIECIPKIMATTYAIDSLAGMFDDIKTLNVYSSSGTGHTYGWTAPSANYTQGMFGSDSGEPEWAKLDGVNFPNSGTPTEGTTYYFKTLD